MDSHLKMSPNISNPKIADGIKNLCAKLDPFYANLREQHIQNGYLLCYRYRISSIENCLQKINTNIWYKQYTFEDLMSFDYPEIIDDTLKKINQLSE